MSTHPKPTDPSTSHSTSFTSSSSSSSSPKTQSSLKEERKRGEENRGGRASSYLRALLEKEGLARAQEVLLPSSLHLLEKCIID